MKEKKTKGKWTEIYTKREDVRKSHEELTEGYDHGEGWACTCGCNKRITRRRHSEGPPRDECIDGYVPTTGGTSKAYRENYLKINWNKK